MYLMYYLKYIEPLVIQLEICLSVVSGCGSLNTLEFKIPLPQSPKHLYSVQKR